MHTERIHYYSSAEFLACRPADSNAGAARVLVRSPRGLRGGAAETRPWRGPVGPRRGRASAALPAQLPEVIKKQDGSMRQMFNTLGKPPAAWKREKRISVDRNAD